MDTGKCDGIPQFLPICHLCGDPPSSFPGAGGRKFELDLRDLAFQLFYRRGLAFFKIALLEV
jgi:hypothetical protein